MAKLNNFRRNHQLLSNHIRKSLLFEGAKEVIDALEKNLDRGVDARGRTLPKKKESTKEAYRKKGYNTRKWFVRTGDSIKWKRSTLANGARISPASDFIKYVKGFTNFFKLNDDIKRNIIKKLHRSIK